VSQGSLNERLRSQSAKLSPQAYKVALYFAGHREEVLVSSAAELAEKARTSDATVVRTAQALGYSGLGELRLEFARDLRKDLSPATRVEKTLAEIAADPGDTLSATISQHADALHTLQRAVSAEIFEQAVDSLIRAERAAIFGIGPSSAIADYLSIQLRRFGRDAFVLKNTGLLLADDMLRLRERDLVLIFAYGRIYPELKALLGRAKDLRLDRVLVTDTLGARLAKDVDLVLQVPRGRVESFSMHTATMAFVEALLVAIATRRPKETLASLKSLNRLRARSAGRAMDL
jgi:DNA-binding MurR/RpiR family transcriptional regulator